jgi:cytosine/uracil/thiamine/allantoin permease
MRDITSFVPTGQQVREHIPTARQVKDRFTTVSAWQLPKQRSALAPEYVWTNEDMDPVPVENQTWTMWTWMAYWATDTINLGTWETASAILAVGLSWREAIPAVCSPNCQLEGPVTDSHRSRWGQHVLLFLWF